MNQHYLYPGKMASFKDETVISTLLGSCVAVAMHDPVTQVGGLNHFLLPQHSSDEVPTHRYGSYSIEAMANELVGLGAHRNRLQAKIYGGANVISVSSFGDGIGARNIEMAEKTLEKMKIPILERNVGGVVARTIKLNTKTFQVTHQLSNPKEGSSEAVDVSGFQSLSVAQNIKVLIVDDSATVRTLFASIFEKNGLTVVGTAADAYQAREMIASKKPDVITLDIEMPKMSGVVFLEKVMAHLPLPVVMVSSLASSGDAALRALELGAIEFVHKPSQFDPAVLKDLAVSLVSKVRAAASVNVLKKMRLAAAAAPAASVPKTSGPVRKSAELKVVTVGGNAGSATAVEALVKGLAADTPPVVVAVSTVSQFLTAFLGKLKGQTLVQLSEGKDGEFLSMGRVYFVPAEVHGEIEMTSQGPKLRLEKSGPVASQIPSANKLFMSAAKSYGSGVFSILLGGFGVDGVDGLQAVQAKGGHCAVQNPDEAQFPYAPQKAIASGLADQVLPASDLAGQLMKYRNQNLY